MSKKTNIYFDRDGEKWSIDKGDWKSHQKADKRAYEAQKAAVKIYTVVALSIIFIAVAAVFILRFFS